LGVTSITILWEKLRASFESRSGDPVTVQLGATSGGLTLAIASPGFEEGRYLNADDMLAVGESIKSLAQHLKEGGGA
jgi:hypothetical protein